MRVLLRFILTGVFGFVCGILILWILQVQKRDELQPWHLAKLDQEFTVGMAENVDDLKAYRELEGRLFNQLKKDVYNKTSAANRHSFNRFHSGSWSDPQRFAVNWNLTYELTTNEPVAGVLMLHGMSDSPYSLRALATRLNKEGAWVVGLRLPGHGTAPSGLWHVQWQDFTAAVRLAMRHLMNTMDADQPLYIVGYSTGAALALEYTLSILTGDDTNMDLPAGLVMLSPAIGVTPVAALAHWKSRLSCVPGLEKMAWISIEPEYDPYKYNSFAVNGGDQLYQLTRRISGQIQALDEGRGVPGMPPVLAFLSAVDSTIPPQSLVDKLFIHLAPSGHSLVLFDVNREANIRAMMKRDADEQFGPLMNTNLPFDMTMIVNRTADTRELVERSKKANSKEIIEKELDMSWPRDIYALSHMALPFSPDDTLYGVPEAGPGESLSLGMLEPRGEHNVLRVPVANLMRLRYNPFYSYVEERTLTWILPGLATKKDTHPEN